MKLTEHFTLEEMTRTKVKGVDNTPSPNALANIIRVCRWLEMLRKEWNSRYGDGDDPVIINSGYRSEAVNKAVGGAQQSNHLTGCAVDIRACGLEQALRYAVILLDISDQNREAFDELILEKKGYVYWVHFAVRPAMNRRHVKCINDN